MYWDGDRSQSTVQAVHLTVTEIDHRVQYKTVHCIGTRRGHWVHNIGSTLHKKRKRSQSRVTVSALY